MSLAAKVLDYGIDASRLISPVSIEHAPFIQAVDLICFVAGSHLTDLLRLLALTFVYQSASYPVPARTAPMPRSDLIDPDKLPLIVLRMMLASIQEEWEPSSELTEAIRAELPMMRVEIESSKPGKPAKQLSGVVVGVGVPAIPGASGK